MTSNEIKRELDQACARLEQADELAQQAGKLEQEGRLDEANELFELADSLLSNPF